MYYAVEDGILDKQRFSNADHCYWRALLVYFVDCVTSLVNCFRSLHFFRAPDIETLLRNIQSFLDWPRDFRPFYLHLFPGFRNKNAERFRLRIFRCWNHIEFYQIVWCHGHRKVVSTLRKELSQVVTAIFPSGIFFWPRSDHISIFAIHFLCVVLKVLIVVRSGSTGIIIYCNAYLAENVNSMLFYCNICGNVRTSIVVDFHWGWTVISLQRIAMHEDNLHLRQLFRFSEVCKRTQKKFPKWDSPL